MHSKRSQEGYFLADHRNSPGITEADLLTVTAYMREFFQPMRGLFESGTIRCCHCGTMVILNPQRTRARTYCQRCDHYVCDTVQCHVECTPFMKTVEETQEAAAKLLNIKEV